MNTESGQPVASSSTHNWKPPSTLPSRLVYPDTYTNKDEIIAAPGKETDPGRMAIYLCLLDERPHLHPSLTALHKHRHLAHGIPPPLKPDSDLPIPTTTRPQSMSAGGSSHAPIGEGMELDILVPIIQVQNSGIEITGNGGAEGAGGVDQGQAEWLVWRFTEEEEARRKAYLPLS